MRPAMPGVCAPGMWTAVRGVCWHPAGVPGAAACASALAATPTPTPSLPAIPAGARPQGQHRLSGAAAHQHGGGALCSERAGGQAGRDRFQVSWRPGPLCLAGGDMRPSFVPGTSEFAAGVAHATASRPVPCTGTFPRCGPKLAAVKVTVLLFWRLSLQVCLSGADSGALCGLAAQHAARGRLPGLLRHFCRGGHHRCPGAGSALLACLPACSPAWKAPAHQCGHEACWHQAPMSAGQCVALHTAPPWDSPTPRILRAHN